MISSLENKFPELRFCRKKNLTMYYLVFPERKDFFYRQKSTKTLITDNLDQSHPERFIAKLISVKNKGNNCIR